MNSKTSDKPSILSAAIRAASQEKERQEEPNASIPENHNTSIPVNNKAITPEEVANMTIKVSKRQRRHWLIEAKKQDTSLTAAIIEALNSRFGSPKE